MFTPCDHVQPHNSGSYHWETELDYNPSHGAGRAAVLVSDHISTSLDYQISQALTLPFVTFTPATMQHGD